MPISPYEQLRFGMFLERKVVIDYGIKVEVLKPALEGSIIITPYFGFYFTPNDVDSVPLIISEGAFVAEFDTPKSGNVILKCSCVVTYEGIIAGKAEVVPTTGTGNSKSTH